MKFLADQNISYRLYALLRAAGHDATHVTDLKLEQADDLVILEQARSDGWVIISADTDFGMLLATQRATAEVGQVRRRAPMVRGNESRIPGSPTDLTLAAATSESDWGFGGSGCP